MMAIYYWDAYSKQRGSRNFGDDINPWLLSHFFSETIIDSADICIVGIGTLLDSSKMAQLSSFKKKIVFSSGAGYGPTPELSDPSWDICCVRGPKTASLLNLDQSKSITDGAVLLGDLFEDLQEIVKSGVVFVPHIGTHLRIGWKLEDICNRIGFTYLSPDTQSCQFIKTLAHARVAVCEAMHGAITADAFRTPWVCCNILYHNEFKWRDWCASVDVRYHPYDIVGDVEWKSGNWAYRGLRKLKESLQRRHLARQIWSLQSAPPNLSGIDVLSNRKDRLKEVINSINESYG